jgi:hypothetical protein
MRFVRAVSKPTVGKDKYGPVPPEVRIPEICCGGASAPFDLNAADYLTRC